MAEKVKIRNLIENGNLVEDTLKEVAPKLSGEDLKALLGVTDLQWERMEKKVVDKLVTDFHEQLFNTLKDGEKMVDLPQIGSLYVQTSSGYKNEDGSPRRRLKINTYKPMRDEIN